MGPNKTRSFSHPFPFLFGLPAAQPPRISWSFTAGAEGGGKGSCSIRMQGGASGAREFTKRKHVSNIIPHAGGKQQEVKNGARHVCTFSPNLCLLTTGYFPSRGPPQARKQGGGQKKPALVIRRASPSLFSFLPSSETRRAFSPRDKEVGKGGGGVGSRKTRLFGGTSQGCFLSLPPPMRSIIPTGA